MDIRLVCSDIDGTLLQYGKKGTGGRNIRTDPGAASAGHLVLPGLRAAVYQPAQTLLHRWRTAACLSVKTAALFFQEEQCIAKNPMPRALAEEIANDMWTRSEGRGEVMLSGQNTAYLMERGLGMLQRVQFVGNHYQIIHSPAEVPEDITKVSVYLHEGVENYVERFVPRWKQAKLRRGGAVLDRYHLCQQGHRGAVRVLHPWHRPRTGDGLWR